MCANGIRLVIFFACAIAPARFAFAHNPAAFAKASDQDESVQTTEFLDDDELYKAQVIAVMGAEGLIFSTAICPFIGPTLTVLAPGAGALAADWVGREMGGRAGSQIAALLGNYALYCLGNSCIAGSLFGLYSMLFALPVVAVGGGAAGALGAAALLFGIAGVGLVGAGLVLTRPFVVPLIWSSFAPPVLDDDEPLEPSASRTQATQKKKATAASFTGVLY